LKLHIKQIKVNDDHLADVIQNMNMNVNSTKDDVLNNLKQHIETGDLLLKHYHSIISFLESRLQALGVQQAQQGQPVQ
jgi:uncharacterized protein YehS (DUF1456 family)